MHALTVLTAHGPGSTFRFTVHPEKETNFPTNYPLEAGAASVKIPLHRDSQGMLRARKRPWDFVLDPPTGIFRLSQGARPLLSGSVQTGKFQPPLLFVRQEPGDRVYGFGTGNGRLLQNESSLVLLNIDTLLSSMPGHSYSSFPFFLIQRGESFIGIFVNVLRPATMSNHGAETNPAGPGTEIQFAEAEPMTIDVFVFLGTPAEILDAYTQLTGRPFLPPTWSLGFHQSRWSYRSAERVLQLAERFRKEDVPCDAIHLDIHYMDRYRVFTWDPKRFADPEKLHAELQELGMRTVAIVDPGVAVAEDYPVYKRGSERGAYCLQSDGRPYLGKVWPGVTVFPDYTRPDVRSWWAEEHGPLLTRGVSGIWNDMNDPVLRMGKRYDPLREDIHHGRQSHASMRNLYANLEAEATREAFAQHQPDRRPFVLTRSATCGIQKAAALWTGDNISNWEHLRENLAMVLNLGLCGVPFSGADIGGFAGRAGILGVIKLRPARELFVRWMQLGYLMPFFRAHTVLYSPDQEPWSFGEEALQINRKFIKRRYALLPYLYRCFRDAHQTGSPVVRPLFFHYPKSPEQFQANQFLVGDSLLAAPVLEAGARSRSVYLPEGDWYDFSSGEPFSGGREHTVAAALDESPLFVKAGSVLPVCRPAQNAEASLKGQVGLEVYPASSLTGGLYADDGGNLEYKNERFLWIDIRGRVDRAGTLTLQLAGKHRRFQTPYRELFVRLPGEYRTMTLRGRKQEGQQTELVHEHRTRIVSTFAIPITAARAEFK